MFRAPRQLPPLEALLADIGQPDADAVAKALDVSPRTFYHWKAQGHAPRPATLALFWESTWGRSVVNAESVNGERWARGLADALQRENATLRARVAYLEGLNAHGAANAPVLLPPVVNPLHLAVS